MKITKVLKTESKNKCADSQEVVFILDNYIQISGIVVSFDEKGEFSGIIWPDNVSFVDKAEGLKVIADLIDKVSMLFAPDVLEEYKETSFGKYIEKYKNDILKKKYSD